MVPDIYEQVALEHRQTLLGEAKHERILAEGQNALLHVTKGGDLR